MATGILSGCEHNFCDSFKTLFQNPEINYQIQNLSKSFTNWIVQKGSDVLVNIPNTVINLFVMFILVEKFSIWYIFSQMIAISFASIFNFVGNKLWTFNDSK